MLKKYKYLLIIAIIILVSGLAYFGQGYLDQRRENRVLDYLNKTSVNRQFVTLINQDRADLKKASGKDKAPLYADMGVDYYAMHAYDYAAEYFAASLSVEPDNGVGWVNLGNAYRQLRDLNNARTAYLKAFEISNYTDSSGCVELGDMLQHDKLPGTVPADGEKQYLDCLAKTPNQNDRQLIARLASYYYDQGDKKNAIKYFDKLSRIEPDNAEVFDILRQLSTGSAQ